MTARAAALLLSAVRTGIAILLLLLPGPAGSTSAEEDELVSLARSRNRVLIADFGLGMCRQCKTQSEILDQVRSVYKEKLIVRMVLVNKEPALAARYRVETIPHLVFFDPAGNVAYRKTGVMRYEEVAARLSRMGVKP
ncbi:MAG: thioredoxin family protein [Deltaproteobacteria bacterium]|nr:thioredoxin family protein [Deltaproteobacteria bacterium]